MKPTIIFFGTGSYTIPVIQKLQNHNLKLIITTDKTGDVARYAAKNNLPLLISDLKNDNDIKTLQSMNPTIGVLASYGAILPKKIIDIFPNGILNIHPSLLPKYKGPSPIQNTILNGDTETGVTIITLDDKVDHGPIAAVQKITLNGNETTEDLKNSLFTLGADLVEVIIQNLENGKETKFHNQDHANESFTNKITTEDGKIDINNPPSYEATSRMIRAYYPNPGTYIITKLGNKERRIKLLPKNSIQVEGKRIMSHKDFINGYGDEAKKLLSLLSL